METAILAVQQSMSQMNIALSMVKKNAESQQHMVNMLAQAIDAAPAPTGGRGQHIDISV